MRAGTLITGDFKFFMVADERQDLLGERSIHLAVESLGLDHDLSTSELWPRLRPLNPKLIEEKTEHNDISS